ncbi:MULTISPECIES: DUF3237 family protein [Paenibacillus]|uniref:DUF3237 family protein n=1 Tax=Paenibacillus illinoisensis TaxID=59845 RepID=UPI001C8ECDA0|nr:MULTISPECIES: DUF3237 family protein [Paenibacillus]MBY0215531.1 DUF3237 family protein [Paenibacillus illinoisensis]WJH29176.1 DUF3237 family protein [Paenibacillus sp. CC-CFT742]
MAWEKVFTVHVAIGDTTDLSNNNDGDSVVMISFGGHVTGKYFEGDILPGGVDTQIIGPNGGRHSLSARYMLQGKDYTGEACKMYIENNGMFDEKLENVLFRTSPKIITNSQALSYLNNDKLMGEGIPSNTGIDIHIYRNV